MDTGRENMKTPHILMAALGLLLFTAPIETTRSEPSASVASTTQTQQSYFQRQNDLGKKHLYHHQDGMPSKIVRVNNFLIKKRCASIEKKKKKYSSRLNARIDSISKSGYSSNKVIKKNNRLSRKYAILQNKFKRLGCNEVLQSATPSLFS